MTLAPGANAGIANQHAVLEVKYGQINGIDVDISAFLLKQDGKVRNDEDMCFYGQPGADSGNVKFVRNESGKAEFSINLPAVSQSVDKIAITATIHENEATFAALQDLSVTVGGVEAIVPSKGKTETALILAEIYRRNGEWKVRCVGQGFAGGLAPLATNFGVVIEEPVQQTVVQPARISLEKKIEAKAPALLSLAKKAQVSLEKKKLTDTVARVGLALDASGSMDWQYKGGKVQQLVNRIVPLAVHFDDNEELECWAFAASPLQLASVTLSNYADIIEKDKGGWKRWSVGARINDEPKAIRQIIDYYEATKDKTPVLLIFVSDGGVHQNGPITELIKRAAKLPIFWQFVGIGGRNYGILEKLDTMSGRVVDNAGFFAIDDLNSVTEEELYDRLMKEFPAWLKEARSLGIVI